MGMFLRRGAAPKKPTYRVKITFTISGKGGYVKVGNTQYTSTTELVAEEGTPILVHPTWGSSGATYSWMSACVVTKDGTTVATANSTNPGYAEYEFTVESNVTLAFTYQGSSSGGSWSGACAITTS